MTALSTLMTWSNENKSCMRVEFLSSKRRMLNKLPLLPTMSKRQNFWNIILDPSGIYHRPVNWTLPTPKVSFSQSQTAWSCDRAGNKARNKVASNRTSTISLAVCVLWLAVVHLAAEFNFFLYGVIVSLPTKKVRILCILLPRFYSTCILSYKINEDISCI